MKKFAKFIPVALGLLTLASCSNDNLFGESQDAAQLKEGDMIVSMTELQEDGETFTRGYTSRDTKSRRWFSGEDRLRVYGLNFSGAFDTYEFVQGLKADKGAFRRINSHTSLSDPSWAVFPYEQIEGGLWEQLPGLYNTRVTVDMTIPQIVEYDAAYDAANYDTDKQPYYLDNIPRWGKVTGTADGAQLQTELKWMTGVLRLQLAGAPAYSNGFRVQMFENGDRSKPIRLNSIDGTPWTVQIAQNNEPVDGACIAFTKNDYALDVDQDGSLYVWMNGTTLNPDDAKRAVVFLPLPVTPGKMVDIVVSVWDYAAAQKTEWDGVVNPASTYPAVTGGTPWADCWKEYATYKNKNIKLGYLYGNKTEYNLALDGTSPTAISDALELTTPDKDDIIRVTANNGIEVCGDVEETTIEIPNKDGKKIILDLREGLKGCAATDPNTLNIVYKDATDPHTGEVVLITPATTTDPKVKLNVDLPKSGFTIVQGGALLNTTFGYVDIDAEQFTVGNDDPTTPTKFSAELVKLSDNVKTFVVAKEAEIKAFSVIQTDPTYYRHGGVNKIIINGKVTDPIDARKYVPDTYEVNVEVTGEKAYANDIFTYGEVNIHDLGLEAAPTVVDDILAKKVTATGWSKVGHIGTTVDPITETVSLSGHINAVGRVVANGNISITEEANVGTGEITSNEGDITINNAYTKAATYGGAITAEKGKVYLNQVGTVRATFSNAITANEFTMEGWTVTSGAVTAHGTATINVDPQEGACPAVTGSLTLDNPTANTLNLTQGYVKKVVNPAGVETSLTFSDEAKYAAIGEVVNPDKLIPTNVSKWNGDWQLKAYSTYFESNGYNHDDGRIWTATQLGYMNTKPLDNMANNSVYSVAPAKAALEIRSDIDLMDEPWPGITATTAVGDLTLKGNDKKISKVNLIGDKTKKMAGFFNYWGGVLNISNLEFNGVKTSIAGVSGGVYAQGIGAVAGQTGEAATLTRVKVKLAGTNFGTTAPTIKNAKTGCVGGLIGAAGKKTDLIGCQVDATGVALTGYNNMGGFIGRSYSTVTIKMDEADDANGIEEMYPSVTGLSFFVTYDATKNGATNDPEQGSTGWFIGSINVDKALTISDVDWDNDLNRAIVQASGSKFNEPAAVSLYGSAEYLYFRRDGDNAVQTLIGNSGFRCLSTSASAPGKYFINGKEFAIYHFGSKAAGAYAVEPGALRLYSITKDPYIPAP